MSGLLLSCRCAVLSVAFSMCVEPDTAVAVAVGLVRANVPAVELAADDPKAAIAAADVKRSSVRESSSSAKKALAQPDPTCDQHGCQLAPRAAPQRRLFGKRR